MARRAFHRLSMAIAGTRGTPLKQPPTVDLALGPGVAALPVADHVVRPLYGDPAVRRGGRCRCRPGEQPVGDAPGGGEEYAQGSGPPLRGRPSESPGSPGRHQRGMAGYPLPFRPLVFIFGHPLVRPLVLCAFAVDPPSRRCCEGGSGGAAPQQMPGENRDQGDSPYRQQSAGGRRTLPPLSGPVLVKSCGSAEMLMRSCVPAA